MLTSQQQQEQLQELLAKLGTSLSLSAVPVLPPPLQAWLAQALLPNSKNEIEQQQQQKKQDDTAQPSDQASKRAVSNSMPSWLQPTSQDEQQELQEAQAQEVILRQQLQELQKLDRNLSERQQELERDKQHALQSVREKQDSVATQHRELQQLDTQMNQQLQNMQIALEDAVRLITKQGSSWLLVAADMSAYQGAEETYKQALLQLCEKMRWQHPAYQPSHVNDSHTRNSLIVDADDVGLPKEVTPAILTELQRLRHAFLLGELEHIHVKTKLTSLQAQVATVKQMLLQEQSAHGYVPWLNENECLRMDATVAELKRDVKKLRGALSECVDKLSQFQDLPVLKGAFEMSAAHTKIVIRNSEIVIGGLLNWGAQAVLLNQLRSSELKRLQDLHVMIDKLSITLADVYNAAEARAVACKRTLDAAEGLEDDATSKHAQQTQTASPAARYNAVRQNQQQRQQVEDGSFIDTLHTLLQNPVVPTPSTSDKGLALAQPAATVKSVVNTMQQLRSSLNAATAAMTDLSEASVPSVISAATSSAQTAQELVCGPGDSSVTTPLMERPELRAMIDEAQSINDKLVDEIDRLSKRKEALQVAKGLQ